MTAFMYVLRCADDSYYVGSTVDVHKRLAQHQAGEGAKYTAKRLPVELIYVEKFDSFLRAFLREKQVQNWSQAKREALIRQDILRP